MVLPQQVTTHRRCGQLVDDTSFVTVQANETAVTGAVKDLPRAGSQASFCPVSAAHQTVNMLCIVQSSDCLASSVSCHCASSTSTPDQPAEMQGGSGLTQGGVTEQGIAVVTAASNVPEEQQVHVHHQLACAHWHLSSMHSLATIYLAQCDQ